MGEGAIKVTDVSSYASSIGAESYSVVTVRYVMRYVMGVSACYCSLMHIGGRQLRISQALRSRCVRSYIASGAKQSGISAIDGIAECIGNLCTRGYVIAYVVGSEYISALMRDVPVLLHDPDFCVWSEAIYPVREKLPLHTWLLFG